MNSLLNMFSYVSFTVREGFNMIKPRKKKDSSALSRLLPIALIMVVASCLRGACAADLAVNDGSLHSLDNVSGDLIDPSFVSHIYVPAEGRANDFAFSLSYDNNTKKGTPMPVDVVGDFPATLSLSFSDKPFLGNVVGLDLTIEAEEDAPNVEVEVSIPVGFSLAKGSLGWKGKLSKGTPTKINVQVRAQKIGEWSLEAVVVSLPPDSYPKVASTRLYVDVTEKDATVSLRSKAENVSVGAVGLGRSKSPENLVTPSSPGIINVYGSFSYYDGGDTPRPCRNAYIELWDDDVSSADDLLGWSYTGSDGSFVFNSISNSDEEGGGQDIFARIFTVNSIVSVTTSTNIIYGWQTTTQSDVSDGPVDHGSWAISGIYRGSWGLYDNVVDGYWWLQNSVGWNRSTVQVRWPYETWPHCHGNVIDVPSGSGWEWDREMVLHEYAHCIHYTAYGNSWPYGSGPNPHYIYSESSGGFAITEGWAEFYSYAVDNRSDYIIWPGETIEANTFADRVDSGDWDGNIVEGAVASIFWDIFDGTSGSDEPPWGDNVDQRFNDLWTVFLNDDPNDMETQFWNSWSTRYGVDTNMWAIFYGSRINEDTTPPAGVVTINGGATYTNSASVTLQASAVDGSGSGVAEMRFMNEGGSWGDWQPYTTSPVAWSLPAGDGVKRVYVQFRDRAGLASGETESYDEITMISLVALFGDGFESASFKAWTGTSSTTGETKTVVTSPTHHGSYSAQFTSNGGGGTENAFSYETISPTGEVYARDYVYVSQSGIVDNNDRFQAIMLRTGITSIAYAGWRQTVGAVKWSLTIRNGASLVTAYSATLPELNRWYCVELHWMNDPVDGLGELWVDGVKVCSVAGKDTSAYGDATSVRFGLVEVVGCGPMSVYVDCVKISDYYIGQDGGDSE